MKQLLTAVLLISLLASCNRTKEVINKTGQTVGEGATEFVNGVGEGIDQTLQSEVVLGDNLKAAGLQTGKFKVYDGAEGDSLTVYIIFNKDFKQNVAVKVYDDKGKEYGRSMLPIEATANEARYIGFAFDKHTDFEHKSKFALE
ncbi:MAG: hypothetical protein U0V74_07845 [Chitinophagales bacterium]